MELGERDSETVPERIENWRLDSVEAQKVTLKAGYYPYINYVLDGINEQIRQTFKSRPDRQLTGDLFFLDRQKGRVRLMLKELVYIRLSEPLRDLFGFEKNYYKGPIFHLAERPMNFKRHLGSLHVYTDIMRDRVVGDTSAALIGMVPAVHDHPVGVKIAHHNFQRPNYFPVRQKFINTVTTNIRDDQGDIVSFEDGTTTLTLHLIRREP